MLAHKPRLRVLSVFGTRPEAIKMAPVVRALEAAPERFESLICLSAQHRDMLDQIIRAFQLEVRFDLDLMRPGQSPCDVASGVFAAMPRVFADARPDIVVVQGDTTTTAATSMAAFMCGIPVAHVEAGLRTNDIRQPFPEEMNRRLATLVSTLHFAPTARARDALLREGVAPESITVTGNTVIDALLSQLRVDYRFERPELAALDASARMILVTLHRRESFGEPMRAVCTALKAIATRHPELVFVLPVHPNPRVKEVVEPELGAHPQFVLTRPLDYLDFIHAMARAYLIVTDSGGVQEEAPTLDRPVLVTREVTERPEGVQAGAARLVGTDAARIIEAVEELLTDPAAYGRMAAAPNPYGDGRAAERIVDALDQWAAACVCS
jgi:UDP-N-acetylglucosamine 2-epimerase (non-hydrolysing)